MMVYVVRYTHKHDDSVEVFSSREKAESNADSLMIDRASHAWEKEDLAKLEAEGDFGQRFSFFHDVEAGISYGERIEIDECEVQ